MKKMKKIVVKVGMSPDVKEIFFGEELKAEKLDGSGIQGALRITAKDNEILGEFDRYVYWRYVETPDPDRLRVLEAVMGKINAILNKGPQDDNGQLSLKEQIQSLMDEERQLELIYEPDKDLLLLNLEYVESFMERLGPGMDTETLHWCMYAVKQYIENNLVPGGPADPDDPKWTWDQFKASFRPAVLTKEEE